METFALDFKQLDAVKRQIAEFSNFQVGSLETYFGPRENPDDVDRTKLGFRHTLAPPQDGDYFSRASTSTCILSLCDTGRWIESGTAWEQYIPDVLRNLLVLEWKSSGLPRDNAFTVAFQLSAACAIIKITNARLSNDEALRLKHGCAVLLGALRPGLVGFTGFPPSTYLTQLSYSAYASARGLLSQHRPDLLKGLHDTEILRNVEASCWAELNKHLALVRCRSRSADAYQLGYAALVAASRPDASPLTPEQVDLLALGLEVLFEALGEDGTWPRSQPLFHYPQFGSAYCFEYEFLGRLLRLPSLQEHLLRYLPDLLKAFKGLRMNAMPQREDGSLAAYLWPSGAKTWVPEAESWSTASAYQFLFHLDRLVAEAIRVSVFNYLAAPYISPGTPKSDRFEFAESFLDCPIHSTDIEEDGLVAALFRHFVEPIAQGARSIELGRPLDRLVPMSAILFGPPGTSKTELSKIISTYLNWPRVTIDPSHFMTKGLDQLQAEADQVFSMLAATERVVVLLDEIDEMVRERSESPEPLNRFLTTAMLPKLSAINRSRRIVFLVATNHISHFDAAIRRPGRFDMVLQVLPPKLEAKLNRPQWRTLIAKAESGWKSLLEFPELEKLTFDEFDVFLRRVATAPTKERKERLLELAISKCTMNDTQISADRHSTEARDQVDEPDEKEGPKPSYVEQAQEPVTWEELSREQARYIRFPFVDAPLQPTLPGLRAANGKRQIRETLPKSERKPRKKSGESTAVMEEQSSLTSSPSDG